MVGGVPRDVDETGCGSLYAQHIATGIHYSNYHYLNSDFSSSRYIEYEMVGGVPRRVEEAKRGVLYAQHIATSIHYSNYYYLKSDFSSSR
jgi:hypothetical protein